MNLWTDRLMARLLGFVHVMIGGAVLHGGTARFPPPSYEALLAFTGGDVRPYGLGWILGGILMIVGKSFAVRVTGMAIIIILSNVWAVLFAVSAYHHPTAAFTPTAAYGGYALLNATLLFLTIIHTRQEHEED